MIDEKGGLTREVTVEDFLDDIREAHDAGIDGFALNCGEWNGAPRYKIHTQKLYEAARRFGPTFKLFFSADGVTAEEAADMVITYGGHPNQLRQDGRPVLSSFGGDEGWVRSIQARLAELGAGPAFVVPYFFPPSRREVPRSSDVAALGSVGQGLDGFFYFGAAGTPVDLAGAIRLHAAEWRRQGKLFMAGITPYYRGLRGCRLDRVRHLERLVGSDLSVTAISPGWQSKTDDAVGAAVGA
jgi:glucan endo-1,3-alpha-glucosidase